MLNISNQKGILYLSTTINFNMASTKIREITITESKGVFSILKKQGIAKEDYDFNGISAVRQVLSNEKARMINVIKTQNPKSIYELAKRLGRSFKSVKQDITLLKRLGFIDLIKESHKNRARLRPIVVVDTMILQIKL